MGLVDHLLDMAAFSGHGNEAQLVESLVGLMHGSGPVGGLNGLLALLESKGLGKEARSWVSTGPNQKVSADRIKHAFDDPQVAAALQRTGISSDQLAAFLSRALPFAINFVTPAGKLPAAAELSKLLHK